MNVTPLLVFVNILCVFCAYPPIGDDVLPGSVLLPATRRGRYLANIVRRQAVDGTGIKFNKDADRINAESKKKVDVLSDELLPYIIAEQERRTTLYKRIMTAIQNGEKGVTIAEIRNKPPLIIRKGLLYRCPSNRAPKEPDGSGNLMCEDDLEPTQIMYDSCLSAEDRELYVAENKYFFCNRHRVEGPDLPRNGSSVVGCAPIERTSLNYTNKKCALEDTDDVVVHYRYYPDRTYKFVTELDPEREVCEHWNPCQIGYIYSLPSPDQALLATELWKNYVEDEDEYEHDEIVAPIPEDSLFENVPYTAPRYTSSARRVPIPEGMKYHQVFYSNPITGNRLALTDEVIVKVDPSHKFLTLTLDFPTWSRDKEGDYLVEFVKKGGKKNLRPVHTKFLTLSHSSAVLTPHVLELLHGQKAKKEKISVRCNRCRLLSVMIRSYDGNVYNLDNSRYKYSDFIDRSGRPQQSIEIDLKETKPQDFGDYFMIMQNGDGVEERLKTLSVLSPEPDTDNSIRFDRLLASIDVGGHFDHTLTYECDSCRLTNILCNGESVLSAGRVSIIPNSRMVNFNFPRFEDDNACVYMGFFKYNGRILKKILAVIEDNSSDVKIPKVLFAKPPKIGDQFEEEVPYTCSGCTVEKLYVNGIPVDSSDNVAIGKDGVPDPFYVVTPTDVIIRISQYTDAYEGVYQAVFRSGDDKIIKTIMEISSTPIKPVATTPADEETTTEEHHEPTPDEHHESTTEEHREPTPDEHHESTTEQHHDSTPEDHHDPTPDEHHESTPEEHHDPTPVPPHPDDGTPHPDEEPTHPDEEPTAKRHK